MNSALELFIEQGIGPTTVDQVTAKSLVAKGTFYLYFKSKDEVVDALVSRFAEELRARIEKAVSAVPEQDWDAKLSNWARACVEGYLDSVRAHDALFYGNRTSTSRRASVDNVVVKSLERLLKLGMTAGAWKVDDVAMTAEFLYCGLHGAVDWAYASEKRLAKAKLVARIEAMVMQALKG
jgi:AcrR family transcriptional regulator